MEKRGKTGNKTNDMNKIALNLCDIQLNVKAVNCLSLCFSHKYNSIVLCFP